MNWLALSLVLGAPRALNGVNTSNSCLVYFCRKPGISWKWRILTVEPCCVSVAYLLQCVLSRSSITKHSIRESPIIFPRDFLIWVVSLMLLCFIDVALIDATMLEALTVSCLGGKRGGSQWWNVVLLTVKALWGRPPSELPVEGALMKGKSTTSSELFLRG